MTTCLKIVKWKLIVNVIYPEFSLKIAFISYLTSLAISMFTPAKAGEIIRIFYVENSGKDYGKTFSLVISDRIIDFFLLFSSGIVGVIVLLALFSVEIVPVWIILLFVLALIIITIVLFNEKIFASIFMPVVNKIFPKKYRGFMTDLYANYFSGVKILLNNKQQLIPAICVGIISWILPIIYGYTLALAIGINAPMLFFVALIPIICVIELIPISISGIGTRDLAVIYLFGLLSISPEHAVIYSMFYLLLYWITGLLGMLLWIKYPIEIPYNNYKN